MHSIMMMMTQANSVLINQSMNLLESAFFSTVSFGRQYSERQPDTSLLLTPFCHLKGNIPFFSA